MADWATISSVATAGGTLILAVATFSAVRSANAAARTAERSLQAGLRPVLMPARRDDPSEKIFWVDGHAAVVGNGRSVVEVAGDVVYLAMPLRNAGAGIGVLHGWCPIGTWQTGPQDHPDPDEFRRLTRDLYVPAGDVGSWQGPLRDASEPIYVEVRAAIEARERFTVDVLYGDHEGGQRTISRFLFTPWEDGSLAQLGRPALRISTAPTRADIGDRAKVGRWRSRGLMHGPSRRSGCSSSCALSPTPRACGCSWPCARPSGA